MEQVHISISGFVQGVGFRQFIKREARKRGVVGWIKNLPDGKVEVVLQGQKDALMQLIALCEKGPMLAKVRAVDAIWENPEEEFTSFDVSS